MSDTEHHRTALPGPAQAGRSRPYPQLLRGPTYRWWRPLLSVLAAVALGLGLAVALLLVSVLLAPVSGGSLDGPTDAWLDGPVGLLYTNLTLAGLIPVATMATWAAFGWRPRWVSSVAPGLRRSWLLRCWLIALASFTVLTGGLELLGGYTWTPEPRWGWLVVVVLLTTPLQAAGEEYLFRGWIPQLVGSMIPGPVVGAVVGGAVSSGLFALAHGQQDPWLFADRYAFGAVACWLVWRTGGLEAGIALHGANNLVALLLTIGAGQLTDTLNASQASPAFVVIDVIMVLVPVALMLRAARSAPPARLFVPPGPPLLP